jgi:membrane dipeptidase
MRYFTAMLCFVALAGCGGQEESNTQGTADKPVAAPIVALNGQQLAQKYLIVDTHIDVPFRLHRHPEDISVATESGQFDYPRAMAGGLNAPFMSIYIPASVEEEGGAKALANTLIDMIEGQISAHPDKFATAHNTGQVEANFNAGLISLPMGMENGGPIEGDLTNVQYFFDRGIRYITLTHSKSNHISDSSYDENKRWGGLSDFGKTLVPEMNRLGLMVDVSHVSDEAFFDVMELTTQPVIASHSSARYFVPGFERNMDDAMLARLATNNGVIQLNIGSGFLSAKSRDSATARSDALKAYVAVNNIAPETDAHKAAVEKISAEYPYVYATMEDVLNHIDHIVAVAGIDHVGIGTDFDGVGDSLPVGFKDVSQYPNFIDGLLGRGYTEGDIEKILGGNLMRVWRTNEANAARMAAQMTPEEPSNDA